MTGMRGALAGFSADGVPRTPGYPDFDEETVPLARELESRYGNTLAERTGCPAFPLSGLPKMLRHAHDPNVRQWLTPQDYVSWCLTGSMLLSAGSALRLGVLRSDAKGYDEPLLSELGLDRGVLPPLCHIGEVMGALRPDVALKLGLQPEIPLVAAPGDVPAALVGASGASVGSVLVSLGSTTVVTAAVPGHARLPASCTREVLPLGARSVETGSGAGGITLEWLARLLGAEVVSLDDLAGEAADGSAVRVGPAFVDPWGTGGGSITGIRPGTGPPELAKAFLLAVAEAALEAVNEVIRFTHTRERLYLTGGGVRSRTICAYFQEKAPLPVVHCGCRELAAEGAAVVAAQAVGLPLIRPPTEPSWPWPS